MQCDYLGKCDYLGDFDFQIIEGFRIKGLDSRLEYCIIQF